MKLIKTLGRSSWMGSLKSSVNDGRATKSFSCQGISCVGRVGLSTQSCRSYLTFWIWTLYEYVILVSLGTYSLVANEKTTWRQGRACLKSSFNFWSDIKGTLLFFFSLKKPPRSSFVQWNMSLDSWVWLMFNSLQNDHWLSRQGRSDSSLEMECPCLLTCIPLLW